MPNQILKSGSEIRYQFVNFDTSTLACQIDPLTCVDCPEAYLVSEFSSNSRSVSKLNRNNIDTLNCNPIFLFSGVIPSKFASKNFV